MLSSLHFGARSRLEQFCRYAAHPPLAIERLSLLPDRLLHRLKRRWRNGTHIIFEPLELVEKLAAVVPPPRFNIMRYHGVLVPAAKWRPPRRAIATTGGFLSPSRLSNKSAGTVDHLPEA
jgi:Putative transposase